MRDEIKDKDYFDRGILFKQNAINEDKDRPNSLPRPEGRVGSADNLCTRSVLLAVQLYSRGDAIPDMRDSVLQMIELLALKRSTLASVQLEKDVRLMYERLDLGTLYESLTLLAFMVSLRLPASDIRYVLELIGHPGEDAMLDHAAHVFGDATRKIAPQSKFPKIYDGLTDVITSSPDQRPAKLKKFVESWYKKMKPISWHDNHKGGEGAYFGYWCFEAALVAMLFNIDDSAVLNHVNYPGDLTRHYRAAI